MIKRIRLYSNENFPIAMVEYLRSLDCDILTSYDIVSGCIGIIQTVNSQQLTVNIIIRLC